MRRFSFLLLFLTFIFSCSQAQDYKEKYRPQFHFTPAENWMNDPNGLVYYKGEYHLFYQHNPRGNKWGHMSWGHAVSTNLREWKHLPVALKEENGIMIFSGSTVVDKQNTSGLGSKQNFPMVAIYTGHHTKTEKQDQRIAYSLDNGRSWTKFKGNPVIEGRQNFRDAKVIWHDQSNQWVMVVALSTEQKIRFYGSDNLKEWKLLSEFGPAGAHKNLLWECPDLFQLNVDGNPNQKKWILQVDINPGSVAGGSGGQYFVGQFDGEKFIQDSKTKGQTLWADYGRDFYAVQSFSNIPQKDGRRIWLAWMNNWDYAQEIPTKPWRSAMTVPRKVGLVSTENGYQLTQQPVDELKKLRTKHFQWNNVEITNQSNINRQDFQGKSYEILAEFKIGNADQFGINIREGANEQTVIGYNVDEQELYVDRRNSGAVNFDSTFASVERAPLSPEGNQIKLHIFVDWSSVEVFANDGKVSVTDQIFPSPSSQNISFFSEGDTTEITSLDIWKLDSIWNR